MKEKKLTPAAICIFGAKGDLTNRKLIPALYNLFIDNHLHSVFAIFCIDFITLKEEDFKIDLLTGVNTFSRSGKADEKNGMSFLPGFFIFRVISQRLKLLSPLRSDWKHLIKRTNKEPQECFIMQ